MTTSDSGAARDAAYRAWRAGVEAELGEQRFEDVLTSTLPGGVRVEALAPDVEARPDAAGLPGLGDQVRGAEPLGPAGGCSVAPLRDEPDAADLNERLLDDLAGGAPAAHVALDRGARLGLGGAADPGARGLVLGTADTLRRALHGVLRDAIELSFDAGANARPLLALLLASEDAEHPGAYELGHAPLAALAADGALPGTLDDAWDDAAHLVGAAREVPLLRPLALDARPWHEAGADAPLELGLLLAEGAELLRALDARGVAPERVARALVLRVALDPDVFPSIALLRAARLTWVRLLRAFGVDPAPPTHVHAFEGARALSRRDPWVNVLRTTTQAFAAQVGGADAFTPLSYDRALGPPGDLGRRLARNTPAVLALEGHVERVVDPAGGSGHVEALTDALARAAWAVLQEVERDGGLAAGLADGSVQARVAASHAARRERLLAGDPGLVGVALFPPEETAVPAAPTPTEPQPRPSIGRAAPSGCTGLAAARAAAEDGCDLAALSAALGRGSQATGTPLGLRRDAAPFEEEGVAPLRGGGAAKRRAEAREEATR